MILPVSVLLVAATVPLTGGKLSRLALLRLAHTWAIVVALALQLVVTVGTVSPVLGTSLHLVSYAFAAIFVVANRHIPGFVLTSSGGAMNLAAISANGGTMPAAPRALELAGIDASGEHFVNSGVVEAARLPWLGDVFAVPASWPLSNVFSVGDVVLVVGVAVLFHRVARRTPAVTDRAEVPGAQLAAPAGSST